MDSQGYQTRKGLADCFSNFSGPYCYRKGIQFTASTILLIATLVIFGLFVNKHRIECQLWMTSMLFLMILALISNIFFCFYNQKFWLFATQTYLFNLYFLVIVSYIVKAFLLKFRQIPPTPFSPKRKLIPKQQTNQNNCKGVQKILFYSTVVILAIVFTVIYGTSVVEQQKQNKNQFNNQPTGQPSDVKYCEQIWYLCFDALCIVLSITVLIVLYKNQEEQKIKMIGFQKQIKRRENDSLLSQQDMDSHSQAKGLVSQQINNPLNKLWIWIIMNVVSQIFNLIESGLFLKAIPPTCMIVKNNPTQSNILQLAFVFLTMYMGFIATLWYIVLVKLIRQKTVIDRTVHYSDQIRIDGNIQLFLPSKEETITFE